MTGGLATGTYKFGAGGSALVVMTGRSGAAAKAGHDLVIDVTSWEATLEIGDDPAKNGITLDADAGSFRVREGTGGMKALGDDDKSSIEKTIAGILEGQRIQFRSTTVEVDDDAHRIHANGDLSLLGKARPVAVDILVDDSGKLSGSVVLKQTDWGIKPYSALFGALQVADEVKVTFDAKLSPSEAPRAK